MTEQAKYPLSHEREVSLFDPAAYEHGCPHARISELRRETPVSSQPDAFDPGAPYPEVKGGWWLHRYDTVQATLRDPELFSSNLG